MTIPKIFIGSSKENLAVARLLKKGLGTNAEVKVWDEKGVFPLNKGFLERLNEIVRDYDYGVFVLAPDDLTVSKSDEKSSVRDNVLFESGLFMGALGRQSVFLVHDEAVDLKIPSDFAGVALATYDGSLVHNADSLEAVATACDCISEEMENVSFRFLKGRWRSRYPMTWTRNQDLCDEVVEITPLRDGVKITTIESPPNDYYDAKGKVSGDSQVSGEWWSREDLSNTRGMFVLNADPGRAFMYGYFTSPGVGGGVTFGSWTLAKICNDETEMCRRLKEAETRLTESTVDLPPATSTT